MSDFEKNYLPLLIKHGDTELDIDNEDVSENERIVRLSQMGLIHLSIFVYKSKKIVVRAKTSQSGMALCELFGDS